MTTSSESTQCTGTKTGTFRRLEEERPRKPLYPVQSQLSTRSGKVGTKSSPQSEEALEDSAEQFDLEIAREVYKKAIIKFETETVLEHRMELAMLFGEYHTFLDQKAKSKLEDLRPEQYKAAIDSRDGPALWIIVLEVLVAGSTHEAEEVNRRVAKVNYFSCRMRKDETTLQTFRIRFEEVFRRYRASGNPEISSEEVARDYIYCPNLS